MSDPRKFFDPKTGREVEFVVRTKMICDKCGASAILEDVPKEERYIRVKTTVGGLESTVELCPNCCEDFILELKAKGTIFRAPSMN